jgi:hypothetical protein
VARSPRGDPEEGKIQDTGAQAPAEALDEDDTRLAHLGYRPQLNRVLGGREIGAHIVDTDAPGTEAETVASQT